MTPKRRHYGFMPVTLSIKNAPDRIVQRLRQRAEKNHRSLQGELMAIIESAVEPDRKLTPRAFFAKVRGMGVNTAPDGADIIRADRDRDGQA